MEKRIFGIEMVRKADDGGQIRISSAAVDRDRDRVLPLGARTSNYLANPVVQWGHNYHDPWATIGQTTHLELSEAGILATFQLREAVNESDPQAIIRALWQAGLIRTASIGFIPVTMEPNEVGGYDFREWELLEWSLVPIPANQEALRLAVKGLVPQSLNLPGGEAPVLPDTALAELFKTIRSLKGVYDGNVG